MKGEAGGKSKKGVKKVVIKAKAKPSSEPSTASMNPVNPPVETSEERRRKIAAGKVSEGLKVTSLFGIDISDDEDVPQSGQAEGQNKGGTRVPPHSASKKKAAPKPVEKPRRNLLEKEVGKKRKEAGSSRPDPQKKKSRVEETVASLSSGLGPLSGNTDMICQLMEKHGHPVVKRDYEKAPFDVILSRAIDQSFNQLNVLACAYRKAGQAEIDWNNSQAVPPEIEETWAKRKADLKAEQTAFIAEKSEWEKSRVALENSLKADRDLAVVAKETAEKALNDKNKELEDLNAVLEAKNQELESAGKKIADLEAKIQTAKKDEGRRIISSFLGSGAFVTAAKVAMSSIIRRFMYGFAKSLGKFYPFSPEEVGLEKEKPVFSDLSGIRYTNTLFNNIISLFVWITFNFYL